MLSRMQNLIFLENVFTDFISNRGSARFYKMTVVPVGQSPNYDLA